MLGTTNISTGSMNNLSISLNGTNVLTYDGKEPKNLDITPAKIGAATSDHTHDYLPLSGGTMTGNISFSMYDRTAPILEIFGGNVDGNGIMLCGAGCTLIGAGESAISFKKDADPRIEKIYLLSDDSIHFFTNGNIYENKVEVVLDSNRNFYPANDKNGSIGMPDNRWNTGYFWNLNLKQWTYADIGSIDPFITFSNGGIQEVYIKYNDWDEYRYPAGLTICGAQGGEYLIVDGDIKTKRGMLYTTAGLVFDSGTTSSGNIQVRATVVSNSSTGSMVNTTRYPLRWYGNEQYALGVMLGDGGVVIIGAGESADALRSAKNISGAEESVYISADDMIRFFVNCNTGIGDSIESNIDRTGKFTSKYINAISGYQLNGTAATLTSTRSSAPNTNVLWAY